MNSTAPEPKAARPKLMIIGLFAIFMGPILLAMFLNIVAPSWLPLGQVNRGTLIEPAVKITFTPSGSNLELAPWKIALLADRDCNEPCTAAVTEMKKVLPALGRKESRVSAVRLKPSATPNDETELANIEVAEFSRLNDLVPSMPAVLLIDPRDFAVLHYEIPVDAGEILKDLERLLRISKQEAN